MYSSVTKILFWQTPHWPIVRKSYFSPFLTLRQTTTLSLSFPETLFSEPDLKISSLFEFKAIKMVSLSKF